MLVSSTSTRQTAWPFSGSRFFALHFPTGVFSSRAAPPGAAHFLDSMASRVFREVVVPIKRLALCALREPLLFESVTRRVGILVQQPARRCQRRALSSWVVYVKCNE